jgi:histidine triad (HIT) family protein
VVSDRRPRDPDCLFCRIVSDELPSSKVDEANGVVAIRDIAPRAPTHILLLTREHIPSASHLTADDGDVLGAVFQLAASIAQREGIAGSGYRIVTNIGDFGGQTVDHLHFHLLGGRAMTWPPG